MWPYGALALALFGALWWMPVRLDGRADINRIPTLRLECHIWRLRWVYDAVVERREGSLSISIRRRGKASREDGGSLVATIREMRTVVAFFRGHPRMSRSLRAGLRMQRLGVSLRVGAQDAAHTALLYGLCCTAAQLAARRVLGRSGIKPSIRVFGDYRNAAFLCSVHCIIAFHIGNIIVAALWIALESIARRLKGSGA